MKKSPKQSSKPGRSVFFLFLFVVVVATSKQQAKLLYIYCIRRLYIKILAHYVYVIDSMNDCYFTHKSEWCVRFTSVSKRCFSSIRISLNRIYIDGATKRHGTLCCCLMRWYCRHRRAVLTLTYVDLLHCIPFIHFILSCRSLYYSFCIILYTLYMYLKCT